MRNLPNSSLFKVKFQNSCCCSLSVTAGSELLKQCGGSIRMTLIQMLRQWMFWIDMWMNKEDYTQLDL